MEPIYLEKTTTIGDAVTAVMMQFLGRGLTAMEDRQLTLDWKTSAGSDEGREIYTIIYKGKILGEMSILMGEPMHLINFIPADMRHRTGTT